MTNSIERVRCDATPAWVELQDLYGEHGTFDLRQAFDTDAQRFASFSQEAPHVFADLSKNLIDEATQTLLLELAEPSGVAQHRDAMFAGE